MREIVPDNDESGGDVSKVRFRHIPTPLRRVRIMHAFSLVYTAPGFM